MSHKPTPAPEGQWINAGHFAYRVTHRPSSQATPVVVRDAGGVSLEPTNHFIQKIGSELSGGTHFVFTASIKPRRGVLPHRHMTHQKFFYVVNGKFRVRINNQIFILGPGDMANFPSTAIHAFHNIHMGGESKALLVVIPGGLEQFFKTANPWERGTPKYLALEQQYGMIEVGNDFIVNSIGMPIVKIEPGTFMMGTPDTEPVTAWNDIMKFQPGADERPQHEVTITKRFGLGMYPVTIGQFKHFVNETGYKTEAEKNGEGAIGIDLTTGNVFPDPSFTWRTPWKTGTVDIPIDDDHPVVSVSFKDAQAFCAWLSQKDNRVYRLPTEAEWEYCCRAGATTKYFFGDNEADLQTYANVADASLQEVWIANTPNLGLPLGTHLPPYAEQWKDGWPFTARVGSFQPNAWGLYDMTGNVGEWCLDWYSPGYYTISPSIDPQGPLDGDVIDVSMVPGLPASIPKHQKQRVIRGGVWLDPPVSYRCAERRTHVRHPVVAGADIGFRVVLEWNNLGDWDPFEPQTGPLVAP